jgi:predicted kinase
MFQLLPKSGLVLLAGLPGSGKSSFADLAFPRSEVVSTDTVRSFCGRGAADLGASRESVEIVLSIARARSARGLRTIIDSTGTDTLLISEAVHIANSVNVPLHLIFFDTSREECDKRNSTRSEISQVPESAMDAMAARIGEAMNSVLEASGTASTATDHVDGVAKGSRLFLSMPVVENLGAHGFRPQRLHFYRRIHVALELAGICVFSAGKHEQYGSVKLSPAAYTTYDLESIEGSQSLLVVTLTELSPDIYLEVGLALGQGKPVGIVRPSGARLSGMLRTLVETKVVREGSYEDEDDAAALAFKLHASAIGA